MSVVLTFQYSDRISIPPPPLQKLADEVSEKWVQRFRTERQQDWQNYW